MAHLGQHAYYPAVSVIGPAIWRDSVHGVIADGICSYYVRKNCREVSISWEDEEQNSYSRGVRWNSISIQQML